jgi:hypothetical protein
VGRSSFWRFFPSGFRFGFAVLEAEAVNAGLDDVAMMGKAVQQRSGHLRVAEVENARIKN